MPSPIPAFVNTRFAQYHIVAQAGLVGLAALTLILGAALVWTGAEIALNGGGVYYIGAGLLFWAGLAALVLAPVSLALLPSGLLLGLTFLWGLIEIAANDWPVSWQFDLLGRIAVPGLIFALLLAVVIWGSPRQLQPRWLRPTAWGAVFAGIAGAGLTLALVWERPTAPAGQEVVTQSFPGHNTAEDWSAFGGSPLGARYTPAGQITRANIADLTEVWRIQTGDMTDNTRISYSAQNTPIYVDGTLFACTPSQQVIALDPATGVRLWHFDPETSESDMESLFSVACRAVAHHRNTAGDERCSARIFVTTVDSRLYALDAASGAICPDFGTQGVVDLALGLGLQETGLASSTSGPAVVGDLVVIGQQVSDNQRRDAPSGVVRAYDAVSGDLIWAWDALRQGIAAEPLAQGEIFPRGTPNVWNVISGDPEAGIIYIATGNSANDHWGGARSAEEDRFTSAVIAIDMQTGETIWDFATVIHDLWDYDLGAQPALMDMQIDGEMRRVVVQGTKQGSLYVLDAATGEHLRPIEQRPAPQGALPGDWTHETQPQAVFYPNFAGRIGPDPETLHHSQTWGVAMIDAALCRRNFLRMDYRGIYTPPSENPHGMLLHPGTVGGINWGGVGLDLARDIVITNHSRLPNVVTMIPRAEVDDMPVGLGGARPDQDVAPQWLAPYGVDRPMWLSILGAPCIAPPWGYVAATDLQSGALLWSLPFGTGFDTGPMGLPTFLRVPLGTVNIGGPLVTASGITFIGAAQDNFFRAYETETGQLLWSARLPAGGQASPMSFVHDGRQYIILHAAGHSQLETTVGDYIIAYALPQ